MHSFCFTNITYGKERVLVNPLLVVILMKRCNLSVHLLLFYSIQLYSEKL